MRKWHLVIAVAILTLAAASAGAQTNPHRSAKKFDHFMTAIGADFLRDWDGDLMQYGPLAPLTNPDWEYLDLWDIDSMLGINCERRNVLDKPDQGVNIEKMKMGNAAQKLDYLWYFGSGTDYTIAEAIALRFEVERHPPNMDPTKQYQGNDNVQYDGFLEHDAGQGRHQLVGVNGHDQLASKPGYLGYSTLYGPDTTINCLVLHDLGHPGYFADSLWNLTFWGTGNGWHHWADDDVAGRLGIVVHQWGYPGPANMHRKYGLRFRMRIDGAFNPSSPDSVIRVQVEQHYAGVSLGKQLDTAIFSDQFFRHSSVGEFDTVTVRFRRAYQLDSTFINLYWPGKLPVTIDWMEALTTKLDTNLDKYDSDCQWLNFAHDDSNSFNESLSYESFTANNDELLKAQTDSLINRYRGYYPILETNEEPPLAHALTIKRAMKLLRDRSDGDMEYMASIQDSSSQGNYYFYGAGLPDQYRMFLEGVRLGWLDSNLYADPKFFWIGASGLYYDHCLPRRALLTGDSLYRWEAQFANTGVNSSGYNTGPWLFYDPDRYATRTHHTYLDGINRLRVAKRACVRSSEVGQRFFTVCQVSDDRPEPNQPWAVNGGWYRVTTESEIRVLANIEASCGASGIYFWNGRHYLVSDSGDHSSNWTWVNVGLWNQPIWLPWWDGHKEHFDALHNYMPQVRTYGDSLLQAAYVGDWTAEESALVNDMAFAPGSIRTRNDSGVTDVFSTRKDSTRNHYCANFVDSALTVHYDNVSEPSAVNRTFVHVSEWLDTIGGVSDTMLYITNLRTDDSYLTDTVPSLQDRRYVSMQLKSPHYAADMWNPEGGSSSPRIQTPFIGIGDSLVVWLNPGEGVLVKLTNAPIWPGGTRLDTNGLAMRALENPAGAYSDLAFYLPTNTSVTMKIYDDIGREVSVLTEGQPMQAGEHLLRWRPSSGLGSGIYTAILVTGDRKTSTQIVHFQ